MRMTFVRFHPETVKCRMCVSKSRSGHIQYELPRTPNETLVRETQRAKNATQSHTPWVLVRCCPCDIAAPHRTAPFSHVDNTLQRKADAALDWYRCTI
eukprot:scaffold29375_cov52-Attheya_sp.AAC.1